MFLTILALITLGSVATAVIVAAVGTHSIEELIRCPAELSGPAPCVSIIVAARNEEKNIADGLSSLLHLAYPAMELIVVNDRSTDRTPDILREMTLRHPQLRVLTVTDLPSGWLGKNYALFKGAEASTGEYLLFTDADVVMDPTVLRRAIAYAQRQQADHVAIGPRSVLPGIWLNVFITGFGVFFNFFTRPWRVSDQRSPAHIGIGAFNLIRRTVYEKIGTHRAIALRPDDDLKLGKLVKKNGLRQRFLLGTDLITVPWYDSVKALVEGLMKNSFAGIDYRLSTVIGSTVLLLVFFVWPFPAVLLTVGVVRWMHVAIATLLLFCAAGSARVQKLSPFYGLGFPLATLMFLYIIWKSTLRTLIRGGIDWRGTFYRLEELKKNVV